ncbi:a-pheromone processing metallopeptidase Ste23 [Lineolata rhizophorae]|uniref:A-pheromone processing metallopeptidase Ste23 n=1 Tax=Lineolata rhizophorae TaxID=578093 RepID=A0A6A6NVF4_9PEZI|nr:a-pheromone processing metallopeptidase Ste23 [Lineolata rhizophorae]
MSEPLNNRHVERLAEQLERPELDNRQYRVIRLPNKLEALLIHDPDTDKASGALDVNVGSFSDEEDMPGMAHAVEHLLFMGTKKYPKENAYNQYLNAHSGYSNAYTGSTSTNYYFEIAASLTSQTSTPNGSAATSASSTREDLTAKTESPLYGALDRFAQFFIEPLFLADTLDRELKAVDSENKKNLQSDNWRLHQLNKSLSNPRHPFCHFSTGSYKTLHDDPLKRGVRIRDEFIRFHEAHYSANLMKLVVLGRENLDELERWVQELFSPVPNKDLPQNRWDDEPPFTENELGMQIFAKPVFDQRVLDLYFPYPDEEALVASHPGRYLSHLIGHEGPGSILAYIKAKGWANGLGAGPLHIGPGAAFFSISIRLTEDGLKEYKEVTKAVFYYIAMLNDQEPQKWIFDETSEMSEVDFRFKQKSPASRTTSALSSVMQQRDLPREWLLSTSLIKEFNKDAIKKGLAHLRHDNFRLTVVSQNYPGEWDKREKWYGTEYKYEPIPGAFREEIRKAAQSAPGERPPELHLPHKNEFIPTRLEVEKKEVETPMTSPRLIRHDENVRTWYKKDDRFWVPKANLHITLRTPIVSVTPRVHVMTTLYRELVQDALVEYSYDAEISGLAYSITNHGVGIDILVNGYNCKMAVLLEKVLVSMRDLEVRDDRFRIVKERLARSMRNWDYGQPYHQVGVYTRWLQGERGWINEQNMDELAGISAADVRAFFPLLLAQFHVEVLVHGNVYKEDALALGREIEAILRPRTLPASQWPTRRALLYPEGSNFVYKRSLKDPANVNNCIEYCLLVGSNQDRPLRAKIMLLAQMTEEPAFDQLRTKEQLGYVVFSGTSVHNQYAGYRVLVQSESSCDYLEQRIDAFLLDFEKSLAEMSEKEFEGHKRAMINKRLEKLKNLSQETNRFWGHIMSEAFDFEAVDHDVAALSTLTKPDMQAFFSHYISPSSPSTRAKLSVHLVAQSSSSAIAATNAPAHDTAALQESRLASLLTKFLNGLGVAVDADALARRFEDVDVAGGDAEAMKEALRLYLTLDQDVEAQRAHDMVAQGMGLLGVAMPSVGVDVSGGPVAAGQNGEGAGANGVGEPVLIEDVAKFKASMCVSSGARPVKDLTEFEESGPKL